MLYKGILSQWDDGRAFAFVVRSECPFLHRLLVLVRRRASEIARRVTSDRHR